MKLLSLAFCTANDKKCGTWEWGYASGDTLLSWVTLACIMCTRPSSLQKWQLSIVACTCLSEVTNLQMITNRCSRYSSVLRTPTTHVTVLPW